MTEALDAKQIIQLIIDMLEITYGNLGYLSFILHSIQRNDKEGIFIIKYSLVPRNEKNRITYEAKIDIKDKKIFEIKQIIE